MSDNPREGHVEVFLEGEWGTISTTDFDEDTTTVICRQLGFHGPAETIKSTEHLGPLSSPEWNIKCPEGAESILGCDISKRGALTDTRPTRSSLLPGTMIMTLGSPVKRIITVLNGITTFLTAFEPLAIQSASIALVVRVSAYTAEGPGSNPGGGWKFLHVLDFPTH
ncbi:hypothetical protein BSL78_06518 [Apostichopus japonicus]|uniref:SRCR domain-containing protein n=1 Tax=Stichopus japonicus TaxID=307972 RepID=A0A2G8L8T2_STIJA|nr:hypothetical protein BSL78_06518 [Apostichopus japonicus]